MTENFDKLVGAILDQSRIMDRQMRTLIHDPRATAEDRGMALALLALPTMDQTRAYDLAREMISGDCACGSAECAKCAFSDAFRADRMAIMARDVGESRPLTQSERDSRRYLPDDPGRLSEVGYLHRGTYRGVPQDRKAQRDPADFANLIRPDDPRIGELKERALQAFLAARRDQRTAKRESRRAEKARKRAKYGPGGKWGANGKTFHAG